MDQEELSGERKDVGGAKKLAMNTSSLEGGEEEEKGRVVNLLETAARGKRAVRQAWKVY